MNIRCWWIIHWWILDDVEYMALLNTAIQLFCHKHMRKLAEILIMKLNWTWKPCITKYWRKMNACTWLYKTKLRSFSYVQSFSSVQCLFCLSTVYWIEQENDHNDTIQWVYSELAMSLFTILALALTDSGIQRHLNKMPSTA